MKQTSRKHLLVGESFLCVRKFTEFVANHVLSDHHRDVVLAVVYQKSDAVNVYRSSESSPNRPTHPTKFGRMVQARAFVRMGTLSSNACFRFEKATKYGPNIRLRGDHSPITKTDLSKPTCLTAK